MTRTGFLEESPGIRSTARLAALLAIVACCALGAAAAFAIVYVTVSPQACHLIAAPVAGTPGEVCITRDMAGHLASLAAIIGALGASAWGALKERNHPDQEPSEPT